MPLTISSAKIKANKVSITDTGDYYASTEVENALQESGSLLDSALYGTDTQPGDPVGTPADTVSVIDAGNYFTSTNAESVLQEIGLDLSTSMSYKGSVSDSAHLPASNQSIGDMYYVVDITTTYLWSGSGWIAVGGGQMTAANVSITDSGDYYTSTNVEGALQEIYTDLGSAAYADIGTLEGNIPALVAGGKLDTAVLPAIAITNTSVVASQSAMLELIAQVGDVAVRSDLNKSFILTVEPATTLTNWQELLTPTDAVLSVNGKTNVVVLNATDVGLGNVTNESKATMFTSPTLTGTVVLPSTTSIGNVDSTEIGYLDNLTGNIQTQLNSKASSTHVHGNLTNTGAIGSTNDLVVVTGTDGILTTASRSGIDSRSTFTPSTHDQAATTITVADSGDYYSSTDVEGVLQEVASDMVIVTDATASDPATIYALKSYEITTTLYAVNWVGSSVPYTYDLTVSGVTSMTNADLLPSTSINITQLEELQFANIIDGGQSTNKFTLKAFGDKPTIDIPIRLIVRGDM